MKPALSLNNLLLLHIDREITFYEAVRNALTQKETI